MQRSCFKSKKRKYIAHVLKVKKENISLMFINIYIYKKNILKKF